MTCSLFTDQNHLDSEIVNEALASSQQVNFPASNLYNRQQRSKVWRSNGYFNIDSSNNTIVFRETDAVDLTATIVEAEYSSSASFALAIALALDTAGASTYTVGIDSTTTKWSIVSDGAGGDGRFELVWTDGASSGAASVLGFSTSTDDVGSLTYTGDYLSINTEEWLEWDFGLPTLPTAFFAFGDRNKAIELSPSAVIEIQGNHTNNWATQIYSETLDYDGRLIHKVDTTGLGTDYLRYWRFRIVDTQNSNGFIQLGYLSLSNHLKPERGAITFGFGANYADLSDSIRVVGGQVYSNVRPKGETFSFSWEKLTKEDKELFDQHFLAKGKHTAFVAYFDPNSAISTSDKYLARLVKYEAEPSWQVVGPNNFTVQMTLSEAL